MKLDCYTSKCVVFAGKFFRTIKFFFIKKFLIQGNDNWPVEIISVTKDFKEQKFLKQNNAIAIIFKNIEKNANCKTSLKEKEPELLKGDFVMAADGRFFF